MNTDPTDKRLFFQLLHKARTLKSLNWPYPFRKTCLYGMKCAMDMNYRDFTIADNMRDVWRQGGVFE